MSRADVLVVGGGVVGCSAAWWLAREGLSVALLERDEIGAHASGASAGMIRPLGESSGNPDFLTWALRSAALFPELVAEVRERSGIDPGYSACGALDVALDEAEVERLRAKAERYADHGLEWLGRDALDREPQLARDAWGGLWSPREASVQSGLLSRALAAAAASLGATIETGAAVTGLLREGARVVGVRTGSSERSAGQVVLCMGTWTPACAAWLGADWQLPIEPVRGQILSLDSPNPPLRSMLVGGGLYFVPRRDGALVVGATEERVGFDCRVTAAGVAGLLAAAPRVVPALADCGFRSAWAGLRPTTPDRLPAVGPLPGAPGALVAAGHHRNGVLLAPVTGRLVADLVLGKELPTDAAALHPDRFLAPKEAT